MKRGEYDLCSFVGCNFERADLSTITFRECTFKDCNLSNALMKNTAFREVGFTDCKMVGVDFSGCNGFLLDFRFNGCNLDFSSFYSLKLKNQQFKECTLRQADFTEASLQAAELRNCDLEAAVFENTLLEKADFSTALNYIIDPEQNVLRKARFSKEGLVGLLAKHDIRITDS